MDAFQTYFQTILNAAQDFDPQVRLWLSKRMVSRAWPRNSLAAIQFMKEKIGKRPFFLYGAGTHTQALLNQLEGDPFLTQLQGILDGYPKPGRHLGVFPIQHAREALNHPQTMIVLSHHEFEDGMLADLLALGVPRQQIMPIYLDEAYGQIAMKQALAELRVQLPEKEAHQKRIVFISARSRRIVGDESLKELAETGDFQLVHILMDRHLRHCPFPHHFNAHNSLNLCLYLLEQLEPDLIYVQEHYSSGNFLPLVIGLGRETPVIGEFYDWLALTFDNPEILNQESYWHPQDVQLALEAEQWCAKHLAGIVTKEDGHNLDEYLKEANILKFAPVLPQTLFCEAEGEKEHLVWAGTIAQSHLSPKLFGDNQLIDVFEDMLKQGLKVTAHSACRSEKELVDGYADYLKLSEEHPFSMTVAMPREQLMPHLAKNYGFGLILGIPKPESAQNISHTVTVAGKFFTYLAAGLPIIVGAYLEVMAQWVKQHGLGLVIEREEINEIATKIRECDYQQMRKNVIAYREKHHLKQSCEALAQFLKDCVG